MVDGTTFAGRSYTDIVKKMSYLKFAEPRSLATYRLASAQRAFAQHGAGVDPSSDRSFVEGLVATGLLKRLS